MHTNDLESRVLDVLMKYPGYETPTEVYSKEYLLKEIEDENSTLTLLNAFGIDSLDCVYVLPDIEEELKASINDYKFDAYFDRHEKEHCQWEPTIRDFILAVKESVEISH